MVHGFEKRRYSRDYKEILANLIYDGLPPDTGKPTLHPKPRAHCTQKVVVVACLFMFQYERTKKPTAGGIVA